MLYPARHLIVSLICLFLLTACGSSDDKKKNNKSEDENIKTGVFIDSPVSNLSYRTESQSGKTNVFGEFEYEVGETIIFSIGNFDFPSALAKSLLTPLDLVGTLDINDPTVIKLARLLQSLDLDGNPENGIVIPDDAHIILGTVQLELDSPDFYDDVESILSDSGSSNDSLVDESDALSHLQNTIDIANDTTLPVITLVGSSQETITQNQSYTEQGASATDNLDGAVNVTISGSVNTSTVGTYTITYSATDRAGNTSTETRTVTVNALPDTEAPVITLTGSSNITISLGDEYTEQGASALDAVDGAIDVVTTGQVDTDTEGTYTVTYTATDEAGNSASEERSVVVQTLITTETIGVIVGSVEGHTAELNSAAVFDVVLESQPSADVVIPLSSSNESEGLTEQTQLTFTSANWGQSQSVVVRGTNAAVLNGVQDYTIILDAIQSDDSGYSGLNPNDVSMKGIYLVISVEEESYNFIASIDNKIEISTDYTGSNDLVYTLIEGAPTGLEINDTSGAITWTPGPDNEGNEYVINVQATDGSLISTNSTSVNVMPSASVGLDITPTLVNVTDTNTNLNGLSFTAVGSETFPTDFSVQRVPNTTNLSVDETITKLSDFFVIEGSIDGDVTVNLPLNGDLSNIPLHTIHLYRLIEHEGNNFWSPVGYDFDYPVDQESPIVTVTLTNLSGVFFVGAANETNTLVQAASSRSVSMFSSALPTSNSNFPDILCTLNSNPDVSYHQQKCRSSAVGKGNIEITVKGFGPTTKWGTVTVEELVSWVVEAQKGFDLLDLDYSNSFTVYVHAFPKSQGYVSIRDKNTLHLNSSPSLSREDIRATSVHEYMHHAQIIEFDNTIAVYNMALLLTKPRWLTEGVAQWFEDWEELSFTKTDGTMGSFDDINNYNDYLKYRGRRIFETGLAPKILDNDLRTDPYQRFSFFKLLMSKCENFRDSGLDDLFFVTSLSLTISDRVELLERKIRTGLCEFDNILGAGVQNDTLASAIAYYQYATQLEGKMSLLDPSEPDFNSNNGMKFDKPLSKFQHTETTVTNWLNNHSPSYKSSLKFTPKNSVPAAGAISFVVPELEWDGASIASLTFKSNGPLNISVVSNNVNFNGQLLDNSYKARNFTVDGEYKLFYTNLVNSSDSVHQVPELFISLINSSLDTPVNDIVVDFEILPYPLDMLAEQTISFTSRIIPEDKEVTGFPGNYIVCGDEDSDEDVGDEEDYLERWELDVENESVFVTSAEDDEFYELTGSYSPVTHTISIIDEEPRRLADCVTPSCHSNYSSFVEAVTEIEVSYDVEESGIAGSAVFTGTGSDIRTVSTSTGDSLTCTWNFDVTVQASNWDD